MSSTFGRSAEIVQPEADQELLGGRVQERPADDLLAADDLDQMAFEQRVQHAGGVDAADLADLERRDRLLVGDDGQRLERLHGELLRRPLVEQAPHPFVQIGARDDLVAAGHLDELQAAGPIVILLELLQRGATSSFGSVSSSLYIAFGVSGSGEAKISASRIAFSSALARRLLSVAFQTCTASRPSSSLLGWRLRPLTPSCLGSLGSRASCRALTMLPHPRCVSGSPIGCGASAGRGRL